ncbi:hypothetical protein HYS93_01945 [Candidatus Daviesbacteria bacterium]|nr:hypothetical protein [Candidatus Daviesbacteria bacterium]
MNPGKEVKNLPSPSDTFIRLPFKTNCFMDLSSLEIHKVRGHRDIRDDVYHYYDLLANTELTLGNRPCFYYDSQYGYVEYVPFLRGVDGQTYLLTATLEEALYFFRNRILFSIYQVSDQQNQENLEFSIDSIPHNFVDGVYIDFWEPNTRRFNPRSRLLDYHQLLNYSLVRMGRSRPDIFISAYQLIVDQLENRGHLSAQAYVTDKNYFELSKRLEQHDLEPIKQIVYKNSGIDDLLGYSILIVNHLDALAIQRAKSEFGINEDTTQLQAIKEAEARLAEVGVLIRWTYPLDSLATNRRFLIEELFFKRGVQQGVKGYANSIAKLLSFI